MCPPRQYISNLPMGNVERFVSSLFLFCSLLSDFLLSLFLSLSLSVALCLSLCVFLLIENLFR